MGLLTILLLLQYRKRYELLQHPKDVIINSLKERYNTASGMNCCNVRMGVLKTRWLIVVTIPQAV